MGAPPPSGGAIVFCAYRQRRFASVRIEGHDLHDKVSGLGAELKELAERKSKDISSAYRQAMRLRGMDG